jgi:geranylgeranyl diphosphate synthase type I
MDFQTYLVQKKILIQKYILDFLSEKETVLDLGKRLKEFIPSGKMIRGALTLFSYEMFGGKEINNMLPVAAAIECIHAGLLIHDDIMDNDLKRRGKPTIFAQYQRDVQHKSNNPLGYGQGMGICSGDFAFFLGYELLGKSQFETKLLSQELQKVIFGQMQDFYFGQSVAEPTLEEIFSIYRNKTARYTFSLPFLLGAVATKQDDHILSQLSKLGEKIGLIFQIKDDEIGLFGHENKTGKPVGSDIRENKKTLIRYYLYSLSNQEQKKILDSKNIKAIITLAKKLKVEEKIKNHINSLEQEAKHIIQTLPVSQKNKQFLFDLVSFVQKRNY